MIRRAIIVLSGPEDGQRFIKIVPDLRAHGLEEAVVLHLLPGGRGPAEPMAELANWVRHFEAALPKVELALKRGDATRWIFELARIRDVELVAISAPPRGTAWDIERVSSPLRTLGIPILYLPERDLEASLRGLVLLAVKVPGTLADVAPKLSGFLGGCPLRGIHVAAANEDRREIEVAGITLDIIPEEGSVATTLFNAAAEREATLLTIMAGERGGRRRTPPAPVVKPLLETTERPLLIWPADV